MIPRRAPVVVLAGRQNVGKSTLFNRLTKTRQALVADYPGLTRDRHYGRAKYYDQPYIVIDTGGFTTDKDDPFTQPVVQQLQLALHEADIIYLLVDARAGLHPLDMELAKMIRQFPAKIYVVANKAEGLDANIVAADFYQLGFGEAQTISASHGDFVMSTLEDTLGKFIIDNKISTDDNQKNDEFADVNIPEIIFNKRTKNNLKNNLKDNIKNFTKELEENSDINDDTTVEPEYNQPIRLAIIGRPNAGKSTLINSIIGHKQLITSPVSGTTRDAIEIQFTYHDTKTNKSQEYILIDTAGVRKKGKIDNIAEKFSVIKTLEAIERSQVVTLVLDSSEGISTQEAHLAHYATTAGKAMVVVFNKWDLLDNEARKKYKEEFEHRVSFLNFALPQPISAEKKQGLQELMLSISKAFASANVKMSTKRLTDILQMAVQRQQPPYSGRFRPKLRYAHQGGKNPPIIVIHGNSLDKVHDDYRRYLQNVFITAFDLVGTPLEIKFKSSENPYS